MERVTRYTCILGLPLGKDSKGVADAVIDTVSALPDMFRRSLTWDQGSEMAKHTHITAAASIPVYFAHPYSPWERPSNENRNRVIRRYLPKCTHITDHQPYLGTYPLWWTCGLAAPENGGSRMGSTRHSFTTEHKASAVAFVLDEGGRLLR